MSTKLEDYTIKIDDIVRAVNTVFGFDFREKGNSRKMEHVLQRMILVYYLRCLLGMKYSHIASFLKKDRKTIYYYLDALAGWIKYDRKIQNYIARVEYEIAK